MLGHVPWCQAKALAETLWKPNEVASCLPKLLLAAAVSHWGVGGDKGDVTDWLEQVPCILRAGHAWGWVRACIFSLNKSSVWARTKPVHLYPQDVQLNNFWTSFNLHSVILSEGLQWLCTRFGKLKCCNWRPGLHWYCKCVEYHCIPLGKVCFLLLEQREGVSPVSLKSGRRQGRDVPYRFTKSEMLKSQLPSSDAVKQHVQNSLLTKESDVNTKV